jgi:hypothetical protein
MGTIFPAQALIGRAPCALYALLVIYLVRLPSGLVRLPSGLVVPHTRAQLEAMWKNVDPLAAKVLGREGESK